MAAKQKKETTPVLIKKKVTKKVKQKPEPGSLDAIRAAQKIGQKYLSDYGE